MIAQKYLHLAVIFKASNLNYGEGVGNILTLKKVTTEGENYSYISRQALRYDVVRMLNELCGYRLTDVDRQAGVIQFAEHATIKDFPEIDFFGYMKTTTSNKIRKAVVRLTDAVSLEPFYNELEFATNKGLADRIPNNVGNDIFQAEIHRSYYCYTLTCNLEEIGVDPIYEIVLDNTERSNRVKCLLNVIKLLNRDIRGKRENLSPLFVIGGLYDVGNPFFYNRIKLSFTKDKIMLNEKLINSTLAIKTFENTVGQQSMLGYIDGEFSNIDDIDIKDKFPIEDFFTKLNEKIDNFYNGLK
ncbi:type I-B CRISPR-associated protein Cas7/Cst2/DevR [Thermodesulfovibrio yellowstonii]|uniref:type I-B CRISPR-associated protein Cas7/Cst2/DevR n=1 Tax=Thermodesulfovibrio yellowstonii TaxID=28262 RepID=UPI0024B3BED1|nr:type I-B CRISPR-associated protein Cas7/Cst2/DevR [Thermodesulfovibrio yellowstonii]MDI6864469.1 type I-B CRISPR-associated protein Cas7/Cst2/DevR [Thermodesulfovibrio yellowstonii]